MKLEGVAFPDSIWDALRDHNLVIFAGAGVSMRDPANLPSFRDLANQIAAGTGRTVSESEKEEVFLGSLVDDQVKIYERAKQILSLDTLTPTETHKNILRLYPEDKVQIVTTNFDLLFERAAQEIFGKETKIESFDAPALPSGKRFTGIVHVHGSVNHHDEIVLTDRDFGRAYLIEGWARRFLVDLFNEFIVLFIGYSHEDPIIDHLAKSLPISKQQRFALVCEDDSARWQRLGIEPILYGKSDKEKHDAESRLVCNLADLVEYGVLDWQREITEVAEKKPPILEDDATSIIKIALKDEIKLRFFVRADTPPEWTEWLYKREYLKPLFSGEELEGKELELSRWLIKKFALKHPDYLFSLIGKNHGS